MVDAFALDRRVFVDAARVTVAFAAIYMVALFYQAFYFQALKYACIQKKERCERYNDPRMRTRDRVVGNLLEWSLPFLTLFWVSMIATGGATLWLGWVYVASRAIYPFLAMNGGIGATGPNPLIAVSTAPSYLSLIALLVAAIRAVL